jgi:hypothetical protein
MKAREQAIARRGVQLSDDHARTDSAAVDNSEDKKGEDIWVTNFITRLAGTLHDIVTARGTEK